MGVSIPIVAERNTDHQLRAGTRFSVPAVLKPPLDRTQPLKPNNDDNTEGIRTFPKDVITENVAAPPLLGKRGLPNRSTR